MPDPFIHKRPSAPTQREPPIVHASADFDDETETLTYEYNGRRIITMTGQGRDGFGYRRSSDGDNQSWPLTQQLYFMYDEPRGARTASHPTQGSVVLDDPETTAQVTFHLSRDAVCMRPSRAQSGQAISGQVGRPLTFGINGVYDIEQDLLIEWYGRRWRWLDDRLIEDENGRLSARLEVGIGLQPWFVNLRPQYYRTHLGYQYHKPWEFRPHTGPVSGWCSWEAYRRDVTEENVAQAAEFFAERLKPYGLRYIQIDDGFEKAPIPFDPTRPIADSWTTTNAQFPSGHEGVISKITGLGLEPGVWTAANITNKQLAIEQPECILKDKDGNCIEGDWLGLVLDCLPETLEKHVLPYYRFLREVGYTYFKADGIRHLLFDGLQKAARMGVLTNDEVNRRFRAFMETARKGIGPDAFFLASWGVITQAAGCVDACRIAMDANPTWAGIRMQLTESARWYHTHRILWQNDPDHICARSQVEWTRSMVSLTSLSGSLFMLSDPLESYDDVRLRIIQTCLPNLPTVTGETGPLDMRYPAFTWTKLHGFAVPREKPAQFQTTETEDALNMAGVYPTMNDAHPFSSLWVFHIDLPARTPWHVVARFATIPLAASEVPLDNLGIDPDKDYVAFDFWAEKYLGRVSGSIACRALDLGHCQIVSLREILPRPQLMASSRHISMDAVSVKSENWDGNELTLELEGVRGTRETYWFHAPAGFGVSEVIGEGIAASFTVDGEAVAVVVDFTAESGTLKLNF